MTTENKRTVVIPGETIVEGDNYLPGDGTEKQGKKIVALKYGLAEEVNKLVKVIPLIRSLPAKKRKYCYREMQSNHIQWLGYRYRDC